VNGTWGKAGLVQGLSGLNPDSLRLTSISCASAGNCTAVGSYPASTSTQLVAVTQADGTWGTAQQVPVDPALNSVGATFTSVSCPSAGNCIAGGEYDTYVDETSGAQALIASQSAGSWAHAEQLPGSATLNTGASADVQAVSCAPSGDCAAGGSYTVSPGITEAFVASGSGGTLGDAEEVPGLGAINVGEAAIDSVSCASDGCAAGGSYVDDSGTQAFVVTGSGGTWGNAEEVPGTAALNTGPPAGSPGVPDATVNSVSCATGGCGAGGFYTDSTDTTDAFVADQTGGTWDTAQEIPAAATLTSGGGSTEIDAVSCTSAGNCSAGGQYEDAAEGYAFSGFVEDEVDGSWQDPEPVPGLDTLNTGWNGEVDSVSCPTTGNCGAGGWYLDSGDHTLPFVVTSTASGGCSSSAGTIRQQASPSGQCAAPPCTQTNPAECLQAANAVGLLDTGDVDAPAGLTLTGSEVIAKDGFAAAEFTDSQGNVIIANEAARYPSPFGTATQYMDHSSLAVISLIEDVTPAALKDAVQFAKKVQAMTSAGTKIYLTGFDLGGTEAEAQAQALGSEAAGCLTFGATGLPGYRADGAQLGCVNFIDYGDSLGNWASDPGGELADLAHEDMDHYGPTDLIGDPNDAALPRFAANTHKVSASGLLDDVLGKQWTDTDAFDKILKLSTLTVSKAAKAYDTVMESFSDAFLGASALRYHSIGRYADDLGVSLTPTVAPPLSMADYERLYDPSSSLADLRAANATTVSADGTIKAPGASCTGSTSTDSLTSETYKATGGSDYEVTYNPAEKISYLKVNLPDGKSYKIINDDSGKYTWSTEVDFYSKLNETGTLTATLYNWRAGGSQLRVFVGLPRGDVAEILSYSSADATGKLLSRRYQK
jgi:hypothetical protein